jgi:serine/threonine-protein kinase SRPK3
MLIVCPTDHLAQIIELIGTFPKDFALSGEFSPEFFSRSGKLRHIERLDFWPLHEVLQEKYGFSAEDGRDLAGFLLPMLEPDPKRRATASQMLKHSWLRNDGE